MSSSDSGLMLEREVMESELGGEIFRLHKSRRAAPSTHLDIDDMMSGLFGLFQKKPVCFYCGLRSAQNYPSNTRQWHCEKCEAENYLDQQGQITDPPPPSPVLHLIPEARYARPAPRPASPELSSSDADLFCSTCQQNHFIVKEILASDSTHEENPTDYKQELYTRYPEVCSSCEPRVRERLRASGKLAKADHLRRMLERSRGRNLDGGNMKTLVASLGAMGWCTSLAGQILWDIQSVVANQEHEEVIGADESSSISTCIPTSWTSAYVNTNCSMMYNSANGLALGLGLFFVWWNPRLKEKSRKGGVKIVGSGDYYCLQLILLLLRFISWSILRSPTYGSDARTVKAVHSLMFVFTAVLTIISFRSIQIDSTPRVLFQDSPESLGPNGQRVGAKTHDKPSYPHRPTNPYNTQPSASTRPFSIHDLAPSRPYQPPYNPPTPPPEDDDAEAMDWTPSQKPLPAASLYRTPKPARVEQPSPFYGRLPQAPKSQAHKLRNPSQPTFQKASSAQKQNFFKRPHSQSNQEEVSEFGSDDESVSRGINRSVMASPEFAPPRFFPSSDFVQDTGLESIFSKTISIAEEPDKSSTARERREQSSLSSHPNPVVQLVFVLLLVFSMLAWWYAARSPGLVAIIHVGSLGVAAIVAGSGLLQGIQIHKDHRSRIGILCYAAELCIAILLVGAVKRQFTDADAYGVRLLGLVLLAFMLLQESSIVISTIRNKPNAQPALTPDPSQTPKPSLEHPPSRPMATTDTRSTTTSLSASSTRPRQRNTVPSNVTTRASTSRVRNPSPSSSSFGGLSLG
ncbi:hypothetical protein MMC07_007697 [Pseudocyphellaria aurata]|nr:hypothetical protein [Pseudocyphellaria aurata]